MTAVLRCRSASGRSRWRRCRRARSATARSTSATTSTRRPSPRAARCGGTSRSPPARAGRSRHPGDDPVVPAPRLSDALGVELLLKLEGANPTHSFKDRIAASAVSAAHAFGLQTLCCASTGNLGEAVAARGGRRGARGGRARPDRAPRGRARPRRTVLASSRVDGTFDDCRGSRRSSGAVPVGLPRRQPADARVRGREDDRLRDRRAARGHAGRGRLAGRVGDALREARAGLRRGARRRSRRSARGRGSSARRPAAARRSRPRGRTTARSRRVRPQTEVRSLAIGDPVFGDLAVGAARMSGGAIRCVPEERDRRPHRAPGRDDRHPRRLGRRRRARHADRSRPRRRRSSEGERVVLVVTGTGLKPYAGRGGGATRPRSTATSTRCWRRSALG